MAMTLDQIRLNQNPILTSLLLGCGQGTMIAETLFPRLPQALSSVMIATMGKQALQRYNLRRAPGATTKRINIKYDGKVYTVNEYSVEVPIPREMIRESEAAKSMGIGENLNISQIAMTTASAVLALDYEIEAAALATSPATYANGNSIALAGGTKWSATTGTPVTDILAAKEMVRGKVGRRPNTVTFSAAAWSAFITNLEVKSNLPSTQTGPCTKEQAKTILDVATINIGDAIWIDDQDAARDVWGNAAIVAYVPPVVGGIVNLVEPAYGFTNVIEGHPYAESPYYDPASKSWIYGGTFERRCNTGMPGAGFLFLNAK